MKKIVLPLMMASGCFNLFAQTAGNVGIGVTVPLTKLHVGGEATIDLMKNTTANTISVDMTKLRNAAGTIWYSPVGRMADNTLTILPGQLQTAVNINQGGSGTILTIPSVLWGTGATADYFYSLKVEGFYFGKCQEDYRFNL